MPAGGGADQLVGQTTTDPYGEYVFADLAQGDYYVVFEKATPADWYKWSPKDVGQSGQEDIDEDNDADPSTGRSHTFTLDPGEEEVKVDAGFYKLGHIEGYAWWYDYIRGPNDPVPSHNGVGIQDEGTAAGGVGVLLLDGVGTVIDTTATLTNGLYSFDYLVPGEYQVQFVQLPGDEWYSYEWTVQHALYDGQPAPDLDSDVDETGYAGPFTIDESGEWFDVDAGIGVIDYSGAEFVVSPDLPRGRGDKLVKPGGVEAIPVRVGFDRPELARPTGAVAIPDQRTRIVPAPTMSGPAAGDTRPRVVSVSGPAFTTRPGVPVPLVPDPDGFDPEPVFVPHGTAVALPA